MMKKFIITVIVSAAMIGTAMANHASRSNYHSDYWQDDTCPPTGCIQ
jgi:hypothetical protein